MSRVLIIPDTHAPCMRKDFVKFLKKIHKKHSCNTVVHIGDLVDWHAISYHQSNLSMRDSAAEYRKAYKQVQQLYKAFPKVLWLQGNHDALVRRKALDAELEYDIVCKGETTIWDVQGWTTVDRFANIEIDGVLYQHGDRGRGGKFPALMNAQDEFKSVVQGHFHQAAGVEYFCNTRTRIFGMQVGCGVQWKHPQMNYGAKYNKKPILGCGVVIDGKYPIFEPMILKNEI